MPHTSSAKKRLRQSHKRRLHNRSVKKAIKVQLKKFAAAVNGPVEELRKEYDLAAKKLDKAAAKRVVHPNLAARKKSQLARVLHQKTAGVSA
ncbi:MAG TPA: 30S ribosomal protein S20 [Gemmataceae bacterium]|nr:30S ribosomal protein S20 [Gemmataceae bacterium]